MRLVYDNDPHEIMTPLSIHGFLNRGFIIRGGFNISCNRTSNQSMIQDIYSVLSTFISYSMVSVIILFGIARKLILTIATMHEH